jgi:hypothetical protein
MLVVSSKQYGVIPGEARNLYEYCAASNASFYSRRFFLALSKISKHEKNRITFAACRAYNFRLNP